LDAILSHDYYFYHPFAVTIKIIDDSLEISKEKVFSPEKVVCIITKKIPGQKKPKSSGRKKFIYYIETDIQGNEVVNEYHINGKMASLKSELDKLSFYLADISDNAIVNVGYYQLSKGKELVCTKQDQVLNRIKPICFSASKKAREYKKNFETIQDYYKMRISLQKKIHDYKNEVRSDPSI
jgi:hypothetical protein